MLHVKRSKLKDRTPRTDDVLRHARNVIIEPAHWTRNVIARDVVGDPVELDSCFANSFCLIGSLERAKSDLGASRVVNLRALNRINKVLRRRRYPDNRRSPTGFNDHSSTTHTDVIALINAALKC